MAKTTKSPPSAASGLPQIRWERDRLESWNAAVPLRPVSARTSLRGVPGSPPGGVLSVPCLSCPKGTVRVWEGIARVWASCTGVCSPADVLAALDDAAGWDGPVPRVPDVPVGEAPVPPRVLRENTRKTVAPTEGPVLRSPPPRWNPTMATGKPMFPPEQDNPDGPVPAGSSPGSPDATEAEPPALPVEEPALSPAPPALVSDPPRPRPVSGTPTPTPDGLTEVPVDASEPGRSASVKTRVDWDGEALRTHDQAGKGGWEWFTRNHENKPTVGVTGEPGKPLTHARLRGDLRRRHARGRHPAVRLPRQVIGVDCDVPKKPQFDTPEVREIWASVQASESWSVGGRGHAYATRFYRLPDGVVLTPGRSTVWAGGEVLTWWHRWQALGPHSSGSDYAIYRPDGERSDRWPVPSELTVIPPALLERLWASGPSKGADTTDTPRVPPSAPQMARRRNRNRRRTTDVFELANARLKPIGEAIGGKRVGHRTHRGRTLTVWVHPTATSRRSFEIEREGDAGERVRFWSPGAIPGAAYDDSGRSTYDRLDVACLKALGRTGTEERTRLARELAGQ